MLAERTIKLPVPGLLFLRVCALLLMAGTVLLCGWYLANNYEGLADWYLGLHDNIAYKATWKQDFFTPENYYKGRLLSILAFTLSFAGLYFLHKTKNRKYARLRLLLPEKDAWIIMGLSILGIVLWITGHRMLEIEIDEVYSAVYGSGIHPFQTISYYMDTNNHILFNSINNLVFHSEDKVFTGRLISLGAYLLLTAAIYLWLKDLLKKRWVAVLITLVVMFQLPVWGFAVRARGYEIYLLCQWLSFIALYKYVVTSNKHWLLLYTVSCIAGFYTLPTFLYCFMTTGLLAVIVQAYQRRLDFTYAIHVLCVLLFTFLLYVPVFLFSGMSAITANPYVVPDQHFDPELLVQLKMYLHNSFWDTAEFRYPFYLALSILPVIHLLIYRKPGERIAVLLYLLAFPVYMVISIILKHYGFLRNIIWQESVSLCMVMVSIYWLLQRINIGKWPLGYLVFGGLVVLQLRHMKEVNRTHLDYNLTGFSASNEWKQVKTAMDELPENPTLYCPNFAIVWHEEAKRRGWKSVVTTPTGHEDFMIVNKIDGLHRPHHFPVPANYRVRKTLTSYVLYERVGTTDTTRN